MIIDAHLIPSTLARSRHLADGVAVVVDILRATTTIATAIENGAARVVTVREVEEARTFREQQGMSGRTLLGGERGSVRIEGFDLANSPLEYTPEVVGGATVVLSTTNGTAAVEESRAAQGILCGSIRNAGAVARWIVEQAPSRLTLVCAGTHGLPAMEDTIGAGAIIDAVIALVGEHTLTDGARLAHLAWREARVDLLAAISRCDHARTLAALGHDEDIAFCAELDRCHVVPLLSGEGFIDAPPSSPATLVQGTVNQQLER